MGVLAFIRKTPLRQRLKEIDRALCSHIADERQHREVFGEEPEMGDKTSQEEQEMLLYRKGVLNKFVLDTLLLSLKRIAWAKQYGFLMGSLATGISMCLYVMLLVFNSTFLVINSISFLVITVLMYILRDRMKELLKTFFHKQAFKWFPDYMTHIVNPYSGKKIGILKESVSFLQESDIPEEIIKRRNKDFQKDPLLGTLHEEVIYYKKQMVLTRNPELLKSRRKKLHNIFLFNIHALVHKASDAFETVLFLDMKKDTLREEDFPKVYHLNVIMKNSISRAEKEKAEIKDFRVVIDKRGIKRVEQIHVRK